MNRHNVVLTGFMGTGKSTVGRLLAAWLGYAFVDTDELIVVRNGRSISDIFRESGEAAFRQMEAAIAQELSGQAGLVIATGGRLMLDEANAAALLENGRAFCLTAEPEEIIARLDGDERRPLLDVPDPAAQIRRLLAARAAAYGRFPQITTSGKAPEQVAEEIFSMVNSQSLMVKRQSVIRLPVSHPGGEYEVVVGEGLLDRLVELAGIDGPFVVVTDSNVGPLYAARCGGATAVITLPAGEQYKTLATVARIYDELLAAGLDRKGTIVALGGGVVGDMAGFAAATYLRGVDFVQCPTSLLAMVDASVGGKVGVDLPQGKNLVGAFKQPTAVLADTATLATLPPAELSAGMAEIIKHGLIANPDLFARLETSDQLPATGYQSLIPEAIQVKRDIVQEDPFEQGRRALLNLGHTFGHAIEQVSGYAIRHGEGVAMGLVAAANLSARLGYCDPALQGRIEVALRRVGLPQRIPATLDPVALYRAMGHDKKKAAGSLRFVLLRDVGEAFVQGGVGETAVRETLEEVAAH
jgi:shikimate kinase / 3-dehydroquinate synthase